MFQPPNDLIRPAARASEEIAAAAERKSLGTACEKTLRSVLGRDSVLKERVEVVEPAPALEQLRPLIIAGGP